MCYHVTMVVSTKAGRGGFHKKPKPGDFFTMIDVTKMSNCANVVRYTCVHT